MILTSFEALAARPNTKKSPPTPGSKFKMNKRMKIADQEHLKNAKDLLRAKAPLLASEQLLQMTKPSLVPNETLLALQRLAPSNSSTWKLVQTPLSDAWSTRLGPKTSAMVRSHQISQILNPQQSMLLEKALLELDKKSDEYALAQFRLAAYEGQTGKRLQAFKRLETLRDSDQSVIDQDLILLSLARLYYEQSDFDSAKRTYDAINKGSDYWLEALEEKAWAEFRLKDFDRAESLLMSVMSPVFEGLVGPEPYFVSSYAKLKVCDYPGIFKTIKSFKSKYQTRMDELSKLSEGVHSEASTRVLAKMASGSIDYKELGADALKLPRLIHRDLGLARTMMYRAQLTDELSQLAAKGHRLAQPFSLVVNEAQAQGYSYIQRLAQTEMDELARIVNKMHILEAEAIGRMYAQNKKSVADIKQKEVMGDELQFPASDEVWVDEIDNYHVTTRGCPAPEKKPSRTSSLVSGESKL
jgi:hypothetical protein